MEYIRAIISGQVLAGSVILLVSVAITLRTMKIVSDDVRGKWAVVLGFLVFFIFGYLTFLYASITGHAIRMELISGSIFLAGAFFVLLVLMIARATVRRLTDSEEEYRSLVESTDDSIYVVDREGRYVFMNDKHQRRLGLTPDEYRGRPYGEFHSMEQSEWFALTIEEVFNSGRPTHFEYESERDDRFFLQTMSPVKDREGRISAVSVISKNITHLKHLEKELRMLSLTDELTGLYNRRGFFTLAEQQIRMASRLRKGVHLLYVDLDFLKLINDNLGHNEGDRALVKLGELLKVTYRESDIIARIGGDEFAVFPVESPDGDMGSVTHRLQENIEQSNSKGHEKFELSISTGIAYFDPDAPVALDELLRAADREMYRDKRARLQP